MLGVIYGNAKDTDDIHSLSPDQDLLLKMATSLGTLLGHLIFGIAADVLGRKRMCECFHYYTFQELS
jgi:hypothetical protein